MLIELDVKWAVASFPALKGFIPRALLLFFIAVITNVTYQSNNHSKYNSTSYRGRFLGAYYNDDANNATSISSSSGSSKNNKYSYQNTDSNYNNDDDMTQLFTPNQIENVPMSAVVFQMVTSWVLGLCALCYFTMGLFCCDRFTAKAFVSHNDPVASTVIPDSFSNVNKQHYKAPPLTTTAAVEDCSPGYLA
jgi:hypothetical protein